MRFVWKSLDLCSAEDSGKMSKGVAHGSRKKVEMRMICEELGGKVAFMSGLCGGVGGFDRSSAEKCGVFHFLHLDWETVDADAVNYFLLTFDAKSLKGKFGYATCSGEELELFCPLNVSNIARAFFLDTGGFLSRDKQRIGTGELAIFEPFFKGDFQKRNRRFFWQHADPPEFKRILELLNRILHHKRNFEGVPSSLLSMLCRAWNGEKVDWAEYVHRKICRDVQKLAQRKQKGATTSMGVFLTIYLAWCKKMADKMALTGAPSEVQPPPHCRPSNAPKMYLSVAENHEETFHRSERSGSPSSDGDAEVDNGERILRRSDDESPHTDAASMQIPPAIEVRGDALALKARGHARSTMGAEAPSESLPNARSVNDSEALRQNRPDLDFGEEARTPNRLQDLRNVGEEGEDPTRKENDSGESAAPRDETECRSTIATADPAAETPLPRAPTGRTQSGPLQTCPTPQEKTESVDAIHRGRRGSKPRIGSRAWRLIRKEKLAKDQEKSQAHGPWKPSSDLEICAPPEAKRQKVQGSPGSEPKSRLESEACSLQEMRNSRQPSSDAAAAAASELSNGDGNRGKESHEGQTVENHEALDLRHDGCSKIESKFGRLYRLVKYISYRLGIRGRFNCFDSNVWNQALAEFRRSFTSDFDEKEGIRQRWHLPNDPEFRNLPEIPPPCSACGASSAEIEAEGSIGRICTFKSTGENALENRGQVHDTSPPAEEATAVECEETEGEILTACARLFGLFGRPDHRERTEWSRRIASNERGRFLLDVHRSSIAERLEMRSLHDVLHPNEEQNLHSSAGSFAADVEQVRRLVLEHEASRSRLACVDRVLEGVDKRDQTRRILASQVRECRGRMAALNEQVRVLAENVEKEDEFESAAFMEAEKMRSILKTLQSSYGIPDSAFLDVSKWLERHADSQKPDARQRDRCEDSVRMYSNANGSPFNRDFPSGDGCFNDPEARNAAPKLRERAEEGTFDRTHDASLLQIRGSNRAEQSGQKMEVRGSCRSISSATDEIHGVRMQSDRSDEEVPGISEDGVGIGYAVDDVLQMDASLDCSGVPMGGILW